MQSGRLKALLSTQCRSITAILLETMNKTSAHVISAVLSPVINPVIAFSLLAWANQQLNQAERIEFSGIASLFASGLMIVCLLLFLRLGLIHSSDIFDRKQRSLPLIVAAIVLFVGFAALSVVHAPVLIQGLMWCYATETLIVAVISYWWKISLAVPLSAVLLIRTAILSLRLSV